MCQLLETLKIVDGKVYNLAYHQQRLEASSLAMYGKYIDLELAAVINCPEELNKGLVKCAVHYDDKTYRTKYQAYSIKEVKSLKLVECPENRYAHKYADRSFLQALLDQKGENDDIMIICDGKVTDASYANLVFKKADKLLTPSSVLLKGTKRQYYLDKNIIEEAEIRPEDLKKYEAVTFINALLDIGDLDWIPVSRIRM